MSHIFHKKPDPENRFDNTTVTIRTDSVSLPDILEAFEGYLKACGFSFEGQLDIIAEEGTKEEVDDE